ncbi:MAG: class I SAM-dependent methyltransferase [Chloroflexota bacterium]|nr:class I SAM-dependent methyltransferase [Chloroflexota bacterium]
MIGERATAVLARLEERDSREREQGVARALRLRQVTQDVGRFLHVLVLASQARSVLEIGTSGGYSTIWLALAARAAGGSVVSLELDPVKVRLARENIAAAGLSETTEVIEGDAFAYLRARGEPAQFVFLDAEKEDYLAYLDLIVPLLAPGGLLVADNLLSHADDLAAFRARALAHPQLSAVVVPIGRGELLAVRTA